MISSSFTSFLRPAPLGLETRETDSTCTAPAPRSYAASVCPGGGATELVALIASLTAPQDGFCV